MNARIEVDHCAGDGSAGTAAVGESDQRSNAAPAKARSAAEKTKPSAASDAGHPTDRLSLDPLRSTDRYRLVAPLSLQF